MTGQNGTGNFVQVNASRNANARQTVISLACHVKC